jgi:signal transduction histidine kinase/CheY-like chemotaxis protein/ligand-binding sensor domain-containing protein
MSIRSQGAIMSQKSFYYLLLLIFLSAASFQEVVGQSLHIIRYSENDGLTNTLVKSVTTNKQGLIYVATDGGLFLFDGREFMHYDGELPSPYVKSVFCRSNGDVVVTTDMGVLVSPGSERGVAPKLLLPGSVQQVDSLLWFPKGCFEDHKNRLWLGDNRKIYNVVDGKVNAYFPGDKAVTNNFQRSFSFIEDENGQLFSFAEPGFVYRLNQEMNRFEEVELPSPLTNIQFALYKGHQTILIATKTGIVEFKFDQNGRCIALNPIPGSPEVSCLYQYAPGRYYAGTWANGLYEIEQNGGNYLMKRLENVTEKNINNIVEGSEGNVWIASDNGLLLLQQNLFSAPFRNTSSDYVQCISGTPDGITYFSDGNRVYSAQPHRELNEFGSASTVKNAKRMILQAIPADGGLWYSDVDARVWFEKPAGKIVKQFDFSSFGRAVFYLKYDTRGNLWVCQDQNPNLIRITSDFGVKMYGRNEGLTSRPLVTTIDDRGTLFAGAMSDTAYLFTYHASKDRFINISEPVHFDRNIDLNINDMVFDRSNVLWLGSSFGLLKYTNGDVSRVDLGPMTGAAVKAITVDQFGNLWLGNSIGLHLFANNELLSFDDRNGISSKIINYRCLHVDASNRLWVGTVEGVMVSSPLKIPRKTVTPVIFTILMNNEEVVVPGLGDISFNDHSFATLKVGVLDYPYVNFSMEMYLQGRDSVWQQVPRSGALILANLPPGPYTLLLRAKKTGNYFTSDLLKWNFTVTQIWYTRMWVVLLLIVLVTLLFWLGIHVYTINLKRYNEKLEHAIQERTHETIMQKERIELQNASMMLKNEELRQANIGLEKAKELAEEASEAQKKFLMVMTHELRTPLNAVIGAAHLLFRNNPRPDQFEELHILRFSAENLLRLINNILDFTKIESGKVSLEKIEFHIRTLVEEIVSAMKMRAKENDIALVCQIDKNIPEILIGDPLRLSQIINNLVGNSLKFTEKGSIAITLTLQERKENDVVIGFEVRDTGIGMTEETLNSIFEMFVQGSSETTRKYGGTGLGLVITRKLLELYDSEIFVQSDPGRGSVFSFSIRFPESKKQPGDISVTAGPYEFSNFQGENVLLVEDNSVNRLIATKFLVDWNLKVESAVNGVVALELIHESSFDLILMDIQMPEMDGYEAATRIRAMGVEPYISLPIIALTAASRSDVSDMIFRSGMNDFISKPFNPVDLHMKIKAFLG